MGSSLYLQFNDTYHASCLSLLQTCSSLLRNLNTAVNPSIRKGLEIKTSINWLVAPTAYPSACVQNRAYTQLECRSQDGDSQIPSTLGRMLLRFNCHCSSCAGKKKFAEVTVKNHAAQDLEKTQLGTMHPHLKSYYLSMHADNLRRLQVQLKGRYV